jgi:glycosyltransferase involved in cell wall biosynthesis
MKLTPKISVVIPCRRTDDPLLLDLIASIWEQDYPQKKIEILTITEGDSESAKAIGIRRAKGDIIGMFCADNKIMKPWLFRQVAAMWKEGAQAIFPYRYYYSEKDNSLNRYFSLIGGNDPICWWLGKNDREPHVRSLTRCSDYQPSYGCNGFFYDAEVIKHTDLDNYYPMDNFKDTGLNCAWKLPWDAIWHRTSDNIFTFLKKRYIYARDLYLKRNNRRWKMLDTRDDYFRLCTFIASSLVFVPTIMQAYRGFKAKRDIAWFWHPIVAISFVLMYTLMTINWWFSKFIGGIKNVICSNKRTQKENVGVKDFTVPEESFDISSNQCQSFRYKAPKLRKKRFSRGEEEKK